MKRKYLVTGSLSVLLILLQADVADSRRSGSRSRSGSSRFGSSRSHSSSSGSPSSSTQGESHSKSSKSLESSSKSVHKSIHPAQNAFPSKHHTSGAPQNPGHSSLYPKQGGGISWGQYNAKPWKPKPPKTKLKHVAGAAIGGAVAGAVGGFLVGRSMSRMQFHFQDPEQEQWWYENRNSYSDRVYFPNYKEHPVPEEVFVRDCVNVTMREFTEPSGNQTATEMEASVVIQVVRQMCTEQYRGCFSRCARRGSFGKIPEMTNTAEAGITGIEGRPNGGCSSVALHVFFLLMPFFLTNLLCY